jgi:hypothetical protein
MMWERDAYSGRALRSARFGLEWLPLSNYPAARLRPNWRDRGLDAPQLPSGRDMAWLRAANGSSDITAPTFRTVDGVHPSL